jgi:hypothetical protein
MPHHQLPSFPLKIGSDRRHLVDQNDRPFLVSGDTAWSIITALTKAEAEQYLANRANKGFNALIVNLIERKFNGPLTRDGDAPFTNLSDLSTPNEKYWTHADWVLQKAVDYGFVVFLAPIYLGARTSKNDEGWFVEALTTGLRGCQEYGRFLGRRYANQDNLIWMMGGDRNPGDALEHTHAVVKGIKEFDNQHLFTAHPAPEFPTKDVYGFGNWLDFNVTYTYGIVHRNLLADYNREPALPFVLIESIYEGEHNSPPVQIRRQAYWALLCGATGQFLGNNPIWAFWPGWQAAMDAEGSRSMVHLKHLFESRPWHTLVPDQFSPNPWYELDFASEKRVVVEGLGEQRGLDFLAAAYTADRRTLIAYMPTARTVSVDLSRLSGDFKRGWWFDPRSSQSLSAGEFPGQDLVKLTPPTDGDWVFVIDDKAANLPAPGL